MNYEKLTSVQKRKVLARYTECLVHQGTELDWIFAVPLNRFDYEAAIDAINKIERELMEMEERELFKLNYSND